MLQPCIPSLPCPTPCSDQEDEWQQLERIQQHDAEWQRQQAAERERREAFRLGQPLRQSLGNPYQQAQAGVPAEASAGGQQRALGQEQHQQGQHQQGQHQQRVYLERELAALQQQRQAEEAAQQGRHQQFQQQQQWEEGEEDEQERAALQQLPSPLNSATSDLDVAVARLLASAGNTPSGPLCQGVRQADAFADVQQREPGERQQETAGRLVVAAKMSHFPTKLPVGQRQHDRHVTFTPSPSFHPLPAMQLPYVYLPTGCQAAAAWRCWSQSCQLRWGRASGGQLMWVGGGLTAWLSILRHAPTVNAYMHSRASLSLPCAAAALLLACANGAGRPVGWRSACQQRRCA